MPAVRKQDALCDNFLYCGKGHTDKPSSCHQDWPHSNGQQWTTPLNVSPPRPNKACLPSQRSLPKFLFKRQRDAVSLSANPVLQALGDTGETTCGKNPHHHPVRFAHVSNGVRGSAPKPFCFPPESMPILKACPPSGRGVSSSQNRFGACQASDIRKHASAVRGRQASATPCSSAFCTAGDVR